jgi:hypothetical protein
MFTAFISVHSDIRNMIQNSWDSEKIFQKQKRAGAKSICTGQTVDKVLGFLPGIFLY